MLRHLLCVFCGFLTHPAMLVAQQLAIDQLEMSIQLELSPESGEVDGDVSIRFINLQENSDSISLNAIRMQVSKLELNGKSWPFRVSPDRISFPTKDLEGDTHLVRIAYRCKPRKGIYFNGWGRSGGKRQIWTQGQGIDHRHWIPHQDDQRDKLRTVLQLRFPSGFQVISNGELVSCSQKNDTITWDFRMQEEHPSYLIALAIGEYAFETDSVDGEATDFIHYLYPEHSDLFPLHYGKTRELFDWMQLHIGLDYPWNGDYRQVPVQNFKHGAMENTGAVIIGDIFLQDSANLFPERTYLEIQAHEMAHHWFGNYLTAESTESHWLHEGFATYWQWESKRKFESPMAYRLSRRKAAQRIWSTYEKIGPFSIQEEKAGSIGFYDKGAWVVSMLMDQTDSAAFSEAIVNILRTHPYSVVNTKQFLQLVEEQLGIPLDDFTEAWVSGGELPLIELTEKGNGRWTVSIEPSMPISFDLIGVDSQGNTDTYSLNTIDNGRSIEVSKGVEALIADPAMRVLARWKIPSQELETEQMFSLPDYILSAFISQQPKLSSRRAEQWLQDWPEGQFPESLLTLCRQLKDDELKVNIFERALNYAEPLAEALLLEESLPQGIPERIVDRYWRKSSYTAREAALQWYFSNDQKGCIERSREALAYEQVSIQSLRVKGALFLYLLTQKEGQDELKELASPKYEFVTRGLALEGMSIPGKELADLSTFSNCMEDFFSPNSRVARPCRSYVKAILRSDAGNEYVKTIEEVASEWSPKWREVFERLTGQQL